MSAPGHQEQGPGAAARSPEATDAAFTAYKAQLGQAITLATQLAPDYEGRWAIVLDTMARWSERATHLVEELHAFAAHEVGRHRAQEQTQAQEIAR